MGAHHGHEHARFDADRRALSIALALIACLMVGELVAGIVAQSLALLADAGHLLSDVAALGFALFAASMAVRPARGRWTFGFGFPAVSAHVLVEPGADCHGVRRTIEDVLRERFDLEHTTLQVDHARSSVVQLSTVERRAAD